MPVPARWLSPHPVNKRVAACLEVTVSHSVC